MSAQTTRTMKNLALLFSLFASATLHAEIYECTNGEGQTIYSDQECGEDERTIRTVDPKINIAPFKDLVSPKKSNTIALYEGSRVGRKSRFLSVSIYEETDTYIIFEVDAYYNGPSNGRGEFRVMPNIHWRARSFSTSEIGVSSGYARVQLGSEGKDGDTSDIITLQLWQYTPDRSPTVIETTFIPYKKKWKKPS